MYLRTTIVAIILSVLVYSCAKTPVMEVVEPSVSMGSLLPGEVYEYSSKVRNNGDGFLKAQARAGCDCIDIVANFPDSIAPKDSAMVIWVYYAPDTAREDVKSILLSSNDPKFKVGKIEVTASVKNRRLARNDSTISLLPFVPKDPALAGLAQQVLQNFYAGAKSALRLNPVMPDVVIEHIMADKQYLKRPTEEVIRKWALMDSIRWLIACDMSGKDGKLTLNCFLIDGFNEFPIILAVNTDQNKVSQDFLATLKSTFSNYPTSIREAMMKGMQRKWAFIQRDVLNKPLPKMEFVNAITGETLTASNFVGKPLVMHFFSIDCEHCEQEMAWMTELVNSHKQDITVIGVSVDVGLIDSVKEFAQKKKLPYPIVLPTESANRKFTRIYGGATPQTIVTDKGGNVADFFLGFNEQQIKKLETTLQRLK
jgi:peroxiredoxin